MGAPYIINLISKFYIEKKECDEKFDKSLLHDKNILFAFLILLNVICEIRYNKKHEKGHHALGRSFGSHQGMGRITDSKGARIAV